MKNASNMDMMVRFKLIDMYFFVTRVSAIWVLA